MSDLWLVSPGDTARLPNHWPDVVTVADVEAGDMAGYELVSWEHGGDWGRTTFPHGAEIELVDSDDPQKRAMLAARREGRASAWEIAHRDAAIAALADKLTEVTP